jgi:hypothetical protein
VVKRGNSSHLQVLIEWARQPSWTTAWEDYDTLKAHFRDAAAWGYSASQGEEPAMLRCLH